MSRFIKAGNEVEVKTEPLEKLKAFGNAEEVLSHYLTRGIINWGLPVSDILHFGMLYIKMARATDTSRLVSVLLEGPSNTGKTALAAHLAKNSGFPFIKVCSPEAMVGYTETEKCQAIQKVFEDAYLSTLSCILVDNIEGLLDYDPIGPRYSNRTLQALLVLLKKLPPPGKNLLIFCTSSERQVLQDMRMLSAFTAKFHVPKLSKPEHLLTVLEDSNVFNKKEILEISRNLQGKRMSIGIKELLGLIYMAKQDDEGHRVVTLLTKLEEDRVDGVNVN